MPPDLLQRNPFLFLGSRLKRLAEQMQTDVLRLSDRAGIALQVGQFPVVALLADAGAMSVTALAKELGLSQPAVSQTIAKLQQAGLVAPAHGGKDRRQHYVALTAEGTRLLHESKRDVWPLVDAAVRDAVGTLDGDFMGQIADLEKTLAAHPLSTRADDLALRRLEPAEDSEMNAIAALMNRGYRGDGEARSWNSEAGYMSGDRTSADALRTEIAATPSASLFVWRHRDSGSIDGCVWLGPLEGDLWYMGSFVIEPSLQNAGLGRRLLAACEARMMASGAREVEIDVVNVRDTLLAWYARRGYRLTGRSRPWPYDDLRYGTPNRDDLRFLILRKRLVA